MKVWSQFFSDILIDVPGCPDPTVERGLLRAAQAFCIGTQVWKLWLENITTQANVTEYDFELEPKSELVKLERATLDGRSLLITTPQSLPDDWRTNSAGLADCIFTSDRKTLTLLPTKVAGLVLRVEAVLKPSNSATGVEDFIFDQYGEVIAMGALARLLQQSNTPYSNPAKGLALDERFKESIAAVGFQHWRAFSSARPRSRLSTF